jgi:hypothetical protein
MNQNSYQSALISGNYSPTMDIGVIICDTTNDVANILLPSIINSNADQIGYRVIIQDGSNSASVNNIVITAVDGDLINGQSSLTINTNGGAIALMPFASKYWVAYPISGGGAPSLPQWLLDGNTNGVIKSIGTLDAFDFPIISNNVEVARFTTDNRLFIGATATNNGSNNGVQYSSLVANRAGLRTNQYGANNAQATLTSFKSRGLVIGAPLSAGDGVLVGDIIQGLTAIAVTGSGLLIPLAYTQRVTAVEVLSGNVACDWEISLCPIGGITNSIRKVFAVTSEGIQRVREDANSMAGLATLDGAGRATVLNTNIKATTRILLTIQEGVVPRGSTYIDSKSPSVRFTIQSTAGALDAGVIVYYQLYEQLT